MGFRACVPSEQRAMSLIHYGISPDNYLQSGVRKFSAWNEGVKAQKRTGGVDNKQKGTRGKRKTDKGKAVPRDIPSALIPLSSCVHWPPTFFSSGVVREGSAFPNCGKT